MYFLNGFYMLDIFIDCVVKVMLFIVVFKIWGLSDWVIVWIFVLLMIFLLLVVNIFLLIWMINFSFMNFCVNWLNCEVDYIGFCNYECILIDSDIWLMMQVIVYFLCWMIFFQVLIGFMFVWLINWKFKGNDFWMMLIVLLMMLLLVVVGNFWMFLYQFQIGFFNYVILFLIGIDLFLF